MLKRVGIVIAILTVIITCLTGCLGTVRGSGNIVTRGFDYSDFKRVEISHAFRAEITHGNSFSINITADDNLFEHVRIVETSDTLKIGMAPGYNYFPNALAVRVVMPKLSYISANGASFVEISGFESQSDFRAVALGASTIEIFGLSMGDVVFEVSTASQINGSISAIDVDIDAFGASRINLSGAARNLQINGSGASNIDLGELEANNAVIGLSTASSAVVNLSGQLDAGLSGASDLKYLGNPSLGNINLSDFSSVGPA